MRKSSQSLSMCSRDGEGCFAKGTLVRTPHGLFPIERIVIGDEVLTHDCRVARVREARVAKATELVRVKFSDDTAVVATPWHRFFDLYGTLVRAEHLVPGTYVRNFDFSVAQVSRLQTVARGVAHDVYNLSLERDVGFFANGKLVEAPHAARILDTKSLLTRAS